MAATTPAKGVYKPSKSRTPPPAGNDWRGHMRSIRSGPRRGDSAIKQATAGQQPEQQKARARPTVGEARK